MILTDNVGERVMRPIFRPTKTDQNELNHVIYVILESRESCDNPPPPGNIAGSLFIRAYTLNEFRPY